MQLVLVESPTKSKTLQGFLGSKYRVYASYGHIRDLPERELGVNIKNDFKPKYIIIAKARKNIEYLKDQVPKFSNIILATDEDREGEAIAFHLMEALNLKNPKRIVFHEITKNAIQEALNNPRNIDMNLVDAQQARRILDRLVGYKLSPLLWKKVARGLSAGRVQSVAVRLIVERGREIQKFKQEEYWSIEAELEKNEQKFLAQLAQVKGKSLDKMAIKNGEEAKNILSALQGAKYQ